MQCRRLVLLVYADDRSGVPYMEMNLISLFDGMGGFPLAWCNVTGQGPADLRYWSSEIEPWPMAVVRERFPNVVELGSVTDVDSENIMEVKRKDYKRRSGGLRKLTEEQVEQSIGMYIEGMSLQQIGEIMNVSRQAMHDLLKRRITLRSNKRYGKDNHFYRGVKSDGAAHDAFEDALRRGLIVKPAFCECCDLAEKRGKDGRSLLCGHHDDYAKPLEVRWLCQSCHYNWHTTNTALHAKEIIGESDEDEYILTFGSPC